ncbi:hypothetical protein C8T65DRAFT_102196 [Cerioporus squamosus]|nr:hypothetical protein C8T65DRAFT_102196 [Cerioporus squamosus]
MEDINPGFVPRALKTIPMNSLSAAMRTPVARPDKGKGKAKEPPSEKPSNGGLLKFFSPRVQGREAPATTEGPSAAGPGRPASAGTPSASTMVVGKKSGKRTLAEVMEDDMAAKRATQEAARASAAATATPRMSTTSKFFHGTQRSVSDPRGGRGWGRAVALAAASSPMSQPVAGSSGLSRCEKENVVPCQEDVRAEAAAGAGEDVDVVLDVCMGEPDAVAQEDGYVSPTESVAQWDSPDISSPLRPGATAKRRRSDGDEWDEIDADVLSSSPVARTTRTRGLPGERFVLVPRALPLRPVVNTSFSSRARRKSLGRKGVDIAADEDDSFGHANGNGDGSGDEAGRGPDLQDVFDDYDWDEITSGGEDEDEDCEIEDEDVIDSTASSTPGAITPATEDAEGVVLEESNSEELEDDMASAAAAEAARNTTVANGWWEKWARSGASTSAGRNHSEHARVRNRPVPALPFAPLRRRETTMTPDGRQRPPRDAQRPYSAPQASKRRGFAQEDLRATGRRSLIFTTVEDVKVTPKAGGQPRSGATSGGPGSRSSTTNSGSGSRAGRGAETPQGEERRGKEYGGIDEE